MRGNTHVRCGERAGETAREKSRNRAPVRLSIVGLGGQSAIATLVDRSSRYVQLVHLPGNRNAETVRDALITSLGGLPESVRWTLTWDQGAEMAHHDQIAPLLRERQFQDLTHLEVDHAVTASMITTRPIRSHSAAAVLGGGRPAAAADRV